MDAHEVMNNYSPGMILYIITGEDIIDKRNAMGLKSFKLNSTNSEKNVLRENKVVLQLAMTLSSGKNVIFQDYI